MPVRIFAVATALFHCFRLLPETAMERGGCKGRVKDAVLCFASFPFTHPKSAYRNADFSPEGASGDSPGQRPGTCR